MPLDWNWKQFCGHNDSFLIWDKDDFGPCFISLVFYCPAHILLAIFSSYYIAFITNRYDRDRLSNWLLGIRIAMGALLFFVSLIEILLQYYVDGQQIAPLDILACGVVSLTWILNILLVKKLFSSLTSHSRGPWLLILAYMLVFTSAAINFRSTVLKSEMSITIGETGDLIKVITFMVHITYFLTLIPKGRSVIKEIYYIPEHRNLVRTEEHIGLLSQLTFWWVQTLMVKGYKGELTNISDLYELPEPLKEETLSKQFQSCFQPFKIKKLKVTSLPEINVNLLDHGHPETREVSVKIKTKTSLIRSLNKCYGCEYFSLGILKLFSDLLTFVGPFLLKLLVSFMESRDKNISLGYYYAAILMGSTFISSISQTQFDYWVSRVKLKVRTSLISIIYHKTLNVSSTSLSTFSTGEVLNFMSTDTDRVLNFFQSFHLLWSLPVQIAVSLYLLYQEVHLAFLAGLAFAIILMPINKWVATKIRNYSTSLMERKDNRIKVMNEILQGIRVIKFYAWEDYFSENIGKLRNIELKSLKGIKYMDAVCVYFWATTPILMSILTFVTYTYMGYEFTASKAFTSVALFNMLLLPLNIFPWVLNSMIDAWVSIKRLTLFLQLDELALDQHYSSNIDNDLIIEIFEGDFSWKQLSGDTSSTKNDAVAQAKTLKLRNINFTVKQGQLIGVIGKVGSGKSSLLSAILAEMHKEDGSVCLSDLSTGFGFVAQESWIQHATVRDNILFGLPYDSNKYKYTVEACALIEDLKILPAGDQTEIGEGGVTLSGGQKARLSLARAVYQDKDIYLLDDPLAAVDAHVAQHLFTNCIMGILKNKTRIICTHHVKFLQKADVVIILEEGRILKAGSPNEVLYMSGVQFHLQEIEDESKKTEASGDEEKIDEEESKDQGILVQEEERSVGEVEFSVYKTYWLSVGSYLSLAVLLSLALMQISKNLNDWWLSFWVTHSHSQHNGTNISYIVSEPALRYALLSSIQAFTIDKMQNITEGFDNLKFYLSVYGGLAGLNSFFTLIRAFLFAYGGIVAAKSIHSCLLSTIMKAPVNFFDVTPLGRIINRFSTDVSTIDNNLPFDLNIVLAQSFGLIGSVAITCYGIPFFAILLLPLALIYYFTQRYYRWTSRELKRLSSVSQSPIYSHFSETLTGLTTIRAFRASHRFQDENKHRLENNQKAVFAMIAAIQWLNLRLQMLGVLMVGGVAFIAVAEYQFHYVSPGLVGLAISYALTVTNLLNGLVTWFTETEKDMVSVERTNQYIEDIKPENFEGIVEPTSDWPDYGVVSFNNVKLQYREGLPFALDGITFKTKPAEKIGIVGRTGSGKSSIFLSLFRIVEIKGGEIVIDDININHMSLKSLRSNLAIIPQDPFVFSGTIRENLDPTNCHTDSDLWISLERCHLKDKVEAMGGLYVEAAEKGRNFSVGQRQLLCLARALLINAKILCIDEATASVDQKTDELIQKTIREAFLYNTVITIAHRINTILDSDRVMVINAGKVEEFDSPYILMKNPNSMFYSLVKQGT